MYEKGDACEHLSAGVFLSQCQQPQPLLLRNDVPLFPQPQPQPQPHSENKRMIMRIRIQLLQQPMFLTSFRLTLTLYGKEEGW